MSTLHIEHATHSYEAWKDAFDRDPVDRRGSGVRRYTIRRRVDDPSVVAVELDFPDRGAAEAMLARLEQLWRTPVAAAALAGPVLTRITETVEVRDL